MKSFKFTFIFLGCLIASRCFPQQNVLELRQAKNYTVQSEFAYNPTQQSLLVLSICDTSSKWKCYNMYFIIADTSRRHFNKKIDVASNWLIQSSFEKEWQNSSLFSGRLKADQIKGTVEILRYTDKEIELALNLKIYSKRSLLCLYIGKQIFSLAK